MCIDSQLKSRVLGLCKVYLKNIYDHVNWEFLYYLLERSRFGEKWRAWIAFCISTVHYSVLINGAPFVFFSSTRGLRQRHPSSPTLFVLVMEAPSWMMPATVERGLLEGFTVRSRNVAETVVSHFLFAGDTLIFCEANGEHLQNLRFLFYVLKRSRD